YSYTDATTLFGQDYSYAVVAVDAAGGVSHVPTGTVFSVSITDPAPAAVTTLTARPLSQLMRAELSWSAPANIGAISGYNVYRKSGSALVQTDLVPGNMIAGPVAGLTYTDDAVPSTAVNYYYAVTAIDESSGLESTIGNSVLLNIPVPPSGVSPVRQFNSAVRLTWTAPAVIANLQSYNVYLRRDAGVWTLSTNVAATSATLQLAGFMPGVYDFAVAAVYSSYGGSAPYESVASAAGTLNITDTAAPADFTVSGALTEASNYTIARLGWDAPSDQNYSGYTPVGIDNYRVEATYNQGVSWGTVISSRLTNPGFEAHTGTVDDTYVDSFTGWSVSYTSAYAVSDAMFDNRAVKIRYNGSGDRYIVSAEPSTVESVANKTYSVSFWAKASNSTTFQFFIQANGGNYESIAVTSPAISGGWQRFTASGTFSGSATATSARVVIRPSADTSIDITIDGVRLETSTGALLANDGTFCRPAGYDTPGSPQSFDDPKALTAGSSAMYRVRAVDAEGNISNTMTTGYIYAKPTVITDLNVTSSSAESANVLTFSPSASLAGLSQYNVYAREQALPLTGVTGATLIGTMTPTTGAGNIALTATATASNTYSIYYPANAADGSTATRWDGLHNVGPNWLRLDFGGQRLLSSVSFDLYNSAYYRPKDYLIQTYDGTSWVTGYTVTDNTNSTPSYTFDPPVLTSQVRIYITKTYDTNMSYRPIINEFRAYASEQYVHDLQNTALKALAGHTYAYAVIAEDVAGLLSDLSGGPVTVNPVTDRDAPAKVSDLALETPVGTSQAVLSWTTPLDNLGFGTGTGAASYQIYRLPTSSVGTPAAVTDDNFATASLVYTGTYASSQAGTFNNYTATWYDHKGVYYAVRSADSSGNWSNISNSPYIIVGKDMEAPTPPYITNCVPVATPEVDVYWDAAVDNVAINGYRLFRADVDIEPFLTDKCITENNVGQAEVAVNLIPYNADSAADTGGTPGKTYYFALRAWDDENNLSNISNCAVATVRTVSTDATPPTWPDTPLTVLQQPYPDIDLFWDPATDLDDSGGAGTIDHYDIYRSLAGFSAVTDPGVSKLSTVSGVRHSYIDRTGNHDTAYYYGIVAVDASVGANAGVLSNIGSATVAAAPSPDNVPPAVPGNLAAATGVYPYINISWSASTDVDDLGSPQQLMYYKLYRADYPLDITESNKDNPDQVNTFIMANDAVSYVASGVGDSMYNYRLEAFDVAGNPSGLSAQATGTVAAAPCVDTAKPDAPGGLTATVGPSPDLDLAWSASSDSGGTCNGVIDHYQLYKADYEITASTDLRTLTHIHVAGNSTSYIDSSGEPNKVYWYVMTAVDSSGNESVMSDIITRTTAADTMAPAAVADLKAQPAAGNALLTWCKPSDNVRIDHYEIYRKEQGTILTDADVVAGNMLTVFVNAGTCLSYTDTGALSGHTYSYAVISVDGAGNRSTISRGESAGDTIASMP
ncbi:MAG TPA: discoidin domain-containing protein, partial [Nitrospirota bacterium]